jgi:mannonate dehydratase
MLTQRRSRATRGWANLNREIETMKRREFARTIAAGSVGAALLGPETALGASPAPAATATPKRRDVLMKVGCQSRVGTTVENLEYFARHGVTHINPRNPASLADGRWDLEDALKQQEQAAKYGLKVEAYHLPLSSAGITRVTVPNIMLGKSPERDREIELIQQMISVAGRAGVPRLMYNTIILPILRTQSTVDESRGNAVYSTFNLQEAYATGMDKERIPGVGEVDVDTVFERITYLLDRVLPVAEEYNVKLGNHIADPPAPVGFMGVTRWNSPDVFAGIRRFAELYDSPSHGFNFCIGSIAEGLQDPRTEILPIIEYAGSRNQIFNIHLRNIKGGWGNFQEVYPDNGDMNFVEVMRALRDVGFDGMVQPDHVPSHPHEGARAEGFAYVYGYIRALIQMLEMEATG